MNPIRMALVTSDPKTYHAPSSGCSVASANSFAMRSFLQVRHSTGLPRVRFKLTDAASMSVIAPQEQSILRLGEWLKWIAPVPKTIVGLAWVREMTDELPGRAVDVTSNSVAA
jgi:hypothetical protein